MADIVKEGYVGVQVEDDFELTGRDESGEPIDTSWTDIDGIPVRGKIEIGRTVRVSNGLMVIDFSNGDFRLRPYDAKDFVNNPLFRES